MMEKRKVITHFTEGERKLFKSLIGHRFEKFENSEIYDGVTVLNPLLLFDHAQYYLSNIPIMDEQVDPMHFALGKPYIILKQTNTREARIVEGQLGENGIKYKRSYGFINIDKEIKDIQIINQLYWCEDDYITWFHSLENGLRFIFTDGSSMCFVATDVDGDFVDYYLDFNEYIEEKKDLCNDNTQSYESKAIRLISLSEEVLSIPLNTFSTEIAKEMEQYARE